MNGSAAMAPPPPPSPTRGEEGALMRRRPMLAAPRAPGMDKAHPAAWAVRPTPARQRGGV